MQASVKWQKDYVFQGTTAEGNTATMDGDRENAPSPMEMVLMAAGSCSSIDIVMILKKSRQDITDVEVKLEGERVDAVPAVFSKINLHFIVSGNNLSEKHVARAVNLSMEKYCSVSIMLGKAMDITHSFEIVSTDTANA